MAYFRTAPLARGESPAITKSIIWSIDGPGLLAHWAIICGWKNRIIAVQAQFAASGTSVTSNSPEAAPSAMTLPIVCVIRSIWATQTSQLSSIAISTISCSLESPT